MAKYQVETDQGTYEVETDEQSLAGKAWDALKIPEAKAKEGLNLITKGGVSAQNALAEKTGLPIGTEPTGNMARDLIANTPRIAGETLAEVAPGFVSRGAILTAGALKGAQMAAPLVAGAGKAIASGAESMSGLSYKTPGILTEAFENPKLIFGKGIEKAREAYNAVKGTPINPALQELMDKKDFVEKSLDLVKNGSITPEEALEARKSLDSIRKTLAEEGYRKAREIFDTIAKQKFAAADEGYGQAVKSEALRRVWPINKTGTPSIAKGVLSTAVPVTAPLFSPMAQGAIASGLGAVNPAISAIVRNPQVGSALGAIVSHLQNRGKQ